MAPERAKKDHLRVRASKACQRCRQRKVQCIGAELGTPCTRCRTDKFPECIFPPSRRGTYTRKRSRPDKFNLNGGIAGDVCQHVAARPVSGSQALFHPEPPTPSAQDVQIAAPQFDPANCDGLQPDVVNNSDSNFECPTTDAGTTDGSSTSTYPSSVYAPKLPNNSLASMFEDFVNRQGYPHDEMDLEKCGIILLGESSPLTFALKELQRGKKASMHDAGSHMSNLSQENASLAAPRPNAHPAHLAAHDIAYLEAKGAFAFPADEVLHLFVDAFLKRFYPLYSLVDKAEFERMYNQQKLPWILLHSVCFIGASYCDSGEIHRSGFKSRLHARRTSYDKAKVLFDIGYETNKIVLLQTVLMLSFWGPQMKSYWNPCSWIGFAVTIAESLGIHKTNASAHMSANDKHLLRRLWWTLAVRDAYCAALLGRPFRINIAQCDTEMLKLTDFYDEASTPEDADEQGTPQALYQIQIAKLSLILRQIVHSRFGLAAHSATTADLHTMLQQWEAHLPPSINWKTATNSKSIFAVSLKIIYHHHLIFIIFGKQGCTPDESDQSICNENSLIKTTESAAQTISATAISLMMNSLVGRMPQEVFPGFFFAGIVFYRQIQRRHNDLAQLSRAALDNCLMIMNETREHWDAAQWVMRIFEFLLSSTSKSDPGPDMGNLDTNSASQANTMLGDMTDSVLPLHSIDFSSPQLTQNLTWMGDDVLLMPNFFWPMTGDDMSLQF